VVASGVRSGYHLVRLFEIDLEVYRMSIEESQFQTEPPPPPRSDVVVIQRPWIVTAVVGVVALVVGGAIGFILALTAYNQGVGDAVTEINASLAEAVGAAQVAQAQQPAQPQAAPATPLPSQLDNVSVDDDPALGPADAPVVIVEFSDYHCPYCKRFEDETLPQIMETYGDQIRFVYRDFPVVGGEVHAVAAECADEQGDYWPYHDALFEDPGSFNSIDDFVALAGELDLDTDAFSQCMESEDIQAEIVSDYQDGRSYGVTGTPTFFINGRRLIGAQPFAEFASIIDEELEGK
jgi:protein-disulfide isomerase